MKGCERVWTSHVYSYALTRSVSDVEVIYGHLNFSVSHFVDLGHSLNWMSLRDYCDCYHGHVIYDDDYFYWTESDCCYGINILVDPYPLS